MNTTARTFALAVAALVMAVASTPASAHPRHGVHGRGHAWHGHGHWAHRPYWGVGIGIGFAPHYAPWHPGYVVVDAPFAVHRRLPVVPYEPVLPPAPEPVIGPRNGQSPAQTEADRRDCDRWAMTQPSAMADAGVFHRTALACMEGRGYAVK